MKKQFPHSARFLIAIFFALSLTSNAQHWRTTGNGLIPVVDAPTAASFVGTTIAVPLNLKTTLNQPVNFFTNNTQRAIIDGTTGFVGIGTNFSTPAFLLDVQNGDINTGNGTINSPQAYRIGGNRILWHAGNVLDIFVGFGAGNGTMTGHQNTFIGYVAGGANTTGFSNTAVGANALLSSKKGRWNVAIGWDAMRAHDPALNQTEGCVAVGSRALASQISGIQNTAIGYYALYNNNGNGITTGTENTGVGSYALEDNTTGARNTGMGDDVLSGNQTGNSNTAIGSEALGRTATGDGNSAVGDKAGYGVLGGSFSRNSFFGFHSGLKIIAGSNNVFMGYQSGENITDGIGNILLGYNTGLTTTTGSRNVLIGQQSNILSNNFTNAIAIGSEAIITAKNKMVLGNDSVNVGIGLSNDVTTASFFGANNKLEINTNLGATPHDPSNGGTGASGLRFRDLHAGGTNYQGVNITENTALATNPFTNPSVLTVDKNGDVILVRDQVGTTSANNGLSVNGGFVQLGVQCGAPLIQFLSAVMQNDRVVPLGGNLLSFYNGATGRVSIGDPNCNVNNTLEIGANSASFYNPTAATGASGLRFSHLNSSHSTVANGTNGVNSSKVLTVDQNGDVVLTDVVGSGFGGACGTSPTGLSSDWEIPLGNSTTGFSYVFSGQGTAKYNVGIGTGCSPSGKLEVLQSSTNSNSLGIRSINTDPDGVALRVESIGTVSGAFTKVAGWFESTPFFTANDQVAIFVPSGKGIVNIGFTSPNLFTSGILNINGSGFASGGTWQTSDSALKHNIQPMDNSLDKIMHLQPVTFEWDTVRDTLMSGIHAGFIAEQVSNVIPQVVRPVSGDLKAISYTELVPYVVNGMQEQQLSIDSLRNAPPGTVAASNGLSVNSGTVELGGALSHPTQIATGPNNFEINNGTNANISLGSNPAVYPGTSGGGANGANIAIGHQNDFTNQHGIALGDLNSVGYYGVALGSGNNLGNSAGSFALGSGLKIENTGGGMITTATGIGEGLHNYASHSIAMGQQLALPPGGSGVFIGSHFSTAAVTSMENYVANNPGATYAQIDLDAENSQQGLSPDVIPGISVTNANRVGVGKLSPGAKLDVYGSINSNGFPVTSDSTLKTNIVTIPNGALAKVNALRPVTYNWINKVDTFMYGTQYGFTAQQVETVIPDLVKTTADNKKHLSYNGLISLLTKALQEQQTHIEHQDSLLDALAAQMDNCCNNGNHYGNSRTVSSVDVELSDADAIVLNQNVPNPFAEQTTITYNIPKSVEVAQILFYDVNGRLIKTVDITKKGKGQLNVFANDLSNGVYSYTLIADGKIFETKKMVKQQ